MHAHGGSPRTTFWLLLVHNGAVPSLLYCLYLRTALPWRAVMLPLLAVLPVRRRCGDACCAARRPKHRACVSVDA